ncbi:hypothetical protein AOLI_G00244450 [Acnodon oligacanthus]
MHSLSQSAGRDLPAPTDPHTHRDKGAGGGRRSCLAEAERKTQDLRSEQTKPETPGAAGNGSGNATSRIRQSEGRTAPALKPELSGQSQHLDFQLWSCEAHAARKKSKPVALIPSASDQLVSR